MGSEAVYPSVEEGQRRRMLRPGGGGEGASSHYLAFIINSINFFPFGKAQGPLGEVADQICDTV